MPGQGIRILGFQGSFKHCAHLTPAREKFLLAFATLGREEEKPSSVLPPGCCQPRGTPPASSPGDNVGVQQWRPLSDRDAAFTVPRESSWSRGGLRATRPTKHTHQRQDEVNNPSSAAWQGAAPPGQARHHPTASSSFCSITIGGRAAPGEQKEHSL